MDVVRDIIDISEHPAFRERVVEFLERICTIDTCPAQELSSLRENEHRVLDIIEAQLQPLQLPGSSILRKEISSAIHAHPAYSVPYYASVPAQEAYRGRHNLLFMLDPQAELAGNGTALNAHIDTVAPHIAPVLQGEVLSGRGSADDKGNVAAIVGTLLVLDELARRRGIVLRNRLTAMFVIDEETGGNGSLDLALDRSLKDRYDSIIVLECTDNELHPANRGAVFIKCQGSVVKQPGGAGGRLSLAEAFAFGILELLKEGEAVKRESDHPLFPHRPVQTCTGILGPFGSHPSAICGEVEFQLVAEGKLPGKQMVEQIIQRGVSGYTAVHGDKTGVVDPATGRRKVEKHYEVRQQGSSYIVKVFGSSGHMGSLPENDAAIAKWAYIAREFVEARIAHENSLRVVISAAPSDEQDELAFEGAQGFLPTHPIEAIKDRVERAFRRGAQEYLDRVGSPMDALLCIVTFDKLHNEAFAGDLNAPSLKRAVRAACQFGLRQENQPLVGWEVSCDARLFAQEYPGLPVITFGAGRLEDAHSNREQLRLPGMFKTIQATTLFVLAETGSVCLEI